MFSSHTGKAFFAYLLPVLFSCSLTACAGYDSSNLSIISGFMDMVGANSGRRKAPHAGVDFWARYGSPVLAAADGEVVNPQFGSGCGEGVILWHSRFGKSTVYCHLSKVKVVPGQVIKRGDVIGLIGATGSSAFGVNHVHFELCTTACLWGHADGDLAGTENPLKISDGCFDAEKSYPEDKLVLTHPIPCVGKAK